jgi:hypothetical protein
MVYKHVRVPLQPAVDHAKLAGKLKELEMSGLVDFGPDKAE